MDIIAKARELGALIQQEECYKKFTEAKNACDADTALNELISKVQMVQLSFQHEASKEDKNEQKLNAYEDEFKQLYDQIMTNDNMKAYDAARVEIDNMMNEITGILALCIQGEDPATCDPNEHNHDCGGECSTCGGCH